MTETYCLKCKMKTADANPSIEISKNGKPMKRSTCGVCGMKKTQFVSAQKGGNPLAIAGMVTEGIGNLAGTIGDQIDKGRRTTFEIDKETGNVAAEKAKNFDKFYRDLMHKRFWDGESLPPRLRFDRIKTNNPKYAKEQEIKDQALWDYAHKQYYGN